jgi:hypothetical protein
MNRFYLLSALAGILLDSAPAIAQMPEPARALAQYQRKL